MGKGLSRDEILPILSDANSRFDPPLSQKEIETCLDSILKTHQRNHPESKSEGKQDVHGHHFSLIQAKDIVSSPEDETDWIWEGILPSGGLSLVVAKPKVGKQPSTFNLAVAVTEERTFSVGKLNKAPVVIWHWKRRRGSSTEPCQNRGKRRTTLLSFWPCPNEAMQEVIAID